MILLSSEEEDEIASQLAGPGWFKYVGEILAREGSSKIIPSNDWRYEWVRDTLRKLETSIPVLASEPELTIEGGSNNRPQPPPAQYPLRPRPRVSEYLHHYCSKLCNDPVTPNPAPPGPPYSLLVVDKPELSNAFSYGFGPDGGSGIVVYSGFIDDIFAKMPPQYGTAPPQKRSFLSKLFGGIFSSSPSPPPHPIPTEEQTAELAILLAHEMAHLILCHHLESLSSVTVIVPGTLSIASDVIRVLIFPFTMLFGPFVNDAVAQLGKVGSLELAKISEHCTSAKQEIEADVVSARQVLRYLRNKFHCINFLIFFWGEIIGYLPMLASMLGMPLNSGKVVLIWKLLNVQGMELIKVIPKVMLRDESWARLIPLANSGSTDSRKNLNDGRT